MQLFIHFLSSSIIQFQPSFKPQVVHGAIKTAQRTGKAILPEQGRKEVFLNIGEIYALNYDLLRELEERINNWLERIFSVCGESLSLHVQGRCLSWYSLSLHLLIPCTLFYSLLFNNAMNLTIIHTAIRTSTK